MAGERPREPQSVIDETREYFETQDVISQFLAEECDTDELGGNSYLSATSGELFSAWSTYAKAAGEAPGSQKAFGDALQRRGFKKHKGGKGVRLFKGVRLTLPPERATSTDTEF